MIPDNPAVVPEFWFRTIVSYPSLPRDVVDTALAEMDLTRAQVEAAQLEITQDQETILIDKLARATGNDLLGLEIGLFQDPKRGSILHYIARSASTLGDLIELTTRYVPITRPMARVELDRTEEGVALKFYNSNPRISVHVQHVEFVVASVIKNYRTLTGIQRLPARVKLASLRRHGHNQIAAVLNCPVELEAERYHEIHLTRDMLALPLKTADSALLSHLTSYGDVLLEQRRKGQPDLRHKIEDAVIDRISFGVPSLGDIAKDLSLSERTLSRRLADDGQSYRAIVDDLRKMMAETYLHDFDMPLAEIAFILGFTDQSSFGTAFRRWTGMSPGRARADLRKNLPKSSA